VKGLGAYQDAARPQRGQITDRQSAKVGCKRRFGESPPQGLKTPHKQRYSPELSACAALTKRRRSLISRPIVRDDPV
jgi:hypothetical protein